LVLLNLLVVVALAAVLVAVLPVFVLVLLAHEVVGEGLDFHAAQIGVVALGHVHDEVVRLVLLARLLVGLDLDVCSRGKTRTTQDLRLVHLRSVRVGQRHPALFNHLSQNVERLCFALLEAGELCIHTVPPDFVDAENFRLGALGLRLVCIGCGRDGDGHTAQE